MNLPAVRAAGIAGILGAICWAIGDILLVGGTASPDQFRLLLRDYADRIPFKALAWMLPFDEPRLAAGAMIANLSIPLYLAGSWHLYQGVKPAGGMLPFTAFILLFCANAWLPLGPRQDRRLPRAKWAASSSLQGSPTANFRSKESITCIRVRPWTTSGPNH